MKSQIPLVAMSLMFCFVGVLLPTQGGRIARMRAIGAAACFIAMLALLVVVALS